MKRLTASLILLCTFSFTAEITAEVSAEMFDHQHSTFTKVLSEVVVVDGHQSRVDYPKLISQRVELHQYLASLSSVSRSEFDEFSPDQQLAYLINTYNAYQLRQVIDHYPLDSIKDVGSFFSSPWSKKFFRLFDEPTSLDIVEHQLIRQLFNEPRIHFAVNCASISCPPIMPQAFVASHLDAQLDAATINFLSDRQANYLQGSTLYLSKIFDWYEEDFGGSVVAFVTGYRPELLQGLTQESGALKVAYSPYNWDLNAH
ncbi:MAG: transcription elongation factor GreA-like protein [Candidatus Azotimanducaceae bacterium]|jgi:transcription elongation factor GreA-like protein